MLNDNRLCWEMKLLVFNFMHLAIVTLALCLLAPASSAQAVEVAGPARVVDGDTLEIGSQSIRLHGINAPEASQVCQTPRGPGIAPQQP